MPPYLGRNNLYKEYSELKSSTQTCNSYTKYGSSASSGSGMAAKDKSGNDREIIIE